MTDEGKSMAWQRRTERMKEEATKRAVEEGTISHGTLNPADLIPALLKYLKTMGENTIVPLHRWPDLAKRVELVEAYIADPETDRQEIVEDLHDAIDAFLPEGYYCGSHPGDGSDIGIWKHEEDD